MKKHQKSPEDQGKGFSAEVARMIADGELSPTEADAAFEKLMGQVKTDKPTDSR